MKIRHGQRTFVGLGFGPIQGGLFLYEEFRSGNFGRLVVAEVVTDTVDAVRSSGGYYAVNIAHTDRIEAARIGPIEIALPGSESDRELIVQAISQAGEIATAVPSVQHYVSEGPGSIHRMLARLMGDRGVRLERPQSYTPQRITIMRLRFSRSPCSKRFLRASIKWCMQRCAS